MKIYYEDPDRWMYACIPMDGDKGVLPSRVRKKSARNSRELRNKLPKIEAIRFNHKGPLYFKRTDGAVFNAPNIKEAWKTRIKRRYREYLKESGGRCINMTLIKANIKRRREKFYLELSKREDLSEEERKRAMRAAWEIDKDVVQLMERAYKHPDLKYIDEPLKKGGFCESAYNAWMICEVWNYLMPDLRQNSYLRYLRLYGAVEELTYIEMNTIKVWEKETGKALVFYDKPREEPDMNAGQPRYITLPKVVYDDYKKLARHYQSYGIRVTAQDLMRLAIFLGWLLLLNKDFLAISLLMFIKLPVGQAMQLQIQGLDEGRTWIWKFPHLRKLLGA